MTTETKNEILRQVLFMNMIDSLKNYEKNGILEKVEEEKKKRDIAEGPAKVQNYGIKSAEQFLQFSTDTFNCAHWDIQSEENGFTAITKGCVVCAIAKQAQAPSPCEMTCISPVRGIIKGINPNHDLEVKETLWDGEKCVFNVKR